MHACQQLQVLVDDGVARIGADTIEVGLAGHAFEDDRADLVQPAMDLRYADAMRLDQPVERDLVFEWEQLCVDTVAAHHERQRFAIALRVDEPRRPPARLPSHLEDPHPERVTYRGVDL